MGPGVGDQQVRLCCGESSVYADGVDGVDGALLKRWAEAGPGMFLCMLVPRDTADNSLSIIAFV